MILNMFSFLRVVYNLSMIFFYMCVGFYYKFHVFFYYIGFYYKFYVFFYYKFILIEKSLNTTR